MKTNTNIPILHCRIQQQKLLADGGFAYVYSGLDADSGDRTGQVEKRVKTLQFE